MRLFLHYYYYYEYMTITTPILQMRKLRYTEDKQQFQGLPTGI